MPAYCNGQTGEVVNIAIDRYVTASCEIDEQRRVAPTLEAMSKVSGVKVKWLSVEPLLEPLKFESLKGIDMIVIGAQSANPGQNDEFAPPFLSLIHI